MLKNVMDAAEILAEHHISAKVLRLMTVEPLPAEAIAQQLVGNHKVIVVEEIANGSGICEDLAMALRSRCNDCEVYGMDLGKRFVAHGNMKSLYQAYGLDANSIAERVMEVLKVEN